MKTNPAILTICKISYKGLVCAPATTAAWWTSREASSCARRPDMPHEDRILFQAAAAACWPAIAARWRRRWIVWNEARGRRLCRRVIRPAANRRRRPASRHLGVMSSAANEKPPFRQWYRRVHTWRSGYVIRVTLPFVARFPDRVIAVSRQRTVLAGVSAGAVEQRRSPIHRLAFLSRNAGAATPGPAIIARLNRLTPWSNDAATRPPWRSGLSARRIDRRNLDAYRSVVRGPAAYTAHHGQGYTTFTYSGRGLDHDCCFSCR